MEPETYFIVRNDQPPRTLGVLDPVVICTEADAPDSMAMYGREEKDRAFEERDKLREEFDNPYINVYRMTVEPVERADK